MGVLSLQPRLLVVRLQWPDISGQHADPVPTRGNAKTPRLMRPMTTQTGHQQTGTTQAKPTQPASSHKTPSLLPDVAATTPQTPEPPAHCRHTSFD